MARAGRQATARPGEGEGGSAAARRAPPPKSANAFRTISEVSAALAVPQHVLRFWETKFAQIKPMKRGGGRRYYRPEDIALLRGIRNLLYTDGYTIKGVQKLLRESGVRILHDRAGSADAAADADEGAVAAREPAGSGAEGGAGKAELAAILDELESLRKLLQGGG